MRNLFVILLVFALRIGLATTNDWDNDGLLDSWEMTYGLSTNDNGTINPDNGAWGDPDADGLPNDEEQFLESSPITNESGYAWMPRPNKARLMVVSAHPDDEGIFFGGTLPYYTQVRQLPTVLVSMTSGDFTLAPEVREAELRDAAWAYGLRNQPVFLRFRDKPGTMGTLEQTWDWWANGSYDSLTDVEEGKAVTAETLAYWIRRYRPDVVVTHGLGGEYGHPNHIATAIATTNALDIAANAFVDLDGLDPWQVKKLYLHNYSTNQLFHDYWQDVSIDTDTNNVADATPIDIANAGLAYHATQAGDVGGLLYVSTVYSNNETYFEWESYPCEWWGLYYSSVGDDTLAGDFMAFDADNNPLLYSGWAKGDFFEHIATFADSDYDEMADAWELAYFTNLVAAAPQGDDDGDGQANLSEFIMGLDPTIVDQLDLSIVSNGTVVAFSVPVASGTGYAGLTRYYALLDSATLTNWSSTAMQGAATGSAEYYPIPTGPTNEFYRLQITLE